MEEKHTWDKINQWADELDVLKAIIAKTELVETNKWGGLIYTYHNKNILGIGGFKSYFGIWFMNGVFLKDPARVLIAATDETKALRQWRFQSKEALNESLILQYIQEAIDNEVKGISHKPQKKEAVVCAFFAHELQKDVAFAAAFEKFSLTKKKEFLEYIASAKQEKTKVSRMEKIKPMVLQNIGLHDQYR
ncbi:YdeI/OmpD-associated family protein [Flavobacterium aciduliphilum]|uniref:Uncharacterized protein YdeI (YjbR/CyaY-like superfamily) n=1 Tax=Flavobacterium aciduliphilum TaxID=1101402 RepID=A0A328YCF0_9FLAO|nr:DUF1801 domain-containing protein [Flavobacterium aciduliphilum]RAR70783.1 uncharacterized protein YdeI (YjbR/CyaY-like superfamily) [Flavobacterium aciduliphilum]